MVVVAFVEQQDVGSAARAAERAAQHLAVGVGQRLSGFLGPNLGRHRVDVRGAVGGAAHEEDVAVDLAGSVQAAPGPEMQPVDVLGDQGEAIAQVFFHPYQGQMPVIGIGGGTDAHPVQVPGP